MVNDDPVVRIGPMAVVVGIVLHDEDMLERTPRFLVTRRNQPSVPSAHGCWQFPGGKIEFGETSSVAIYREMREELSLTLKDLGTARMLPYFGTTLYETDKGPLHTVLLPFFFAAHHIAEPVLTDKGADAMAWMTAEELHGVRTLPALVPMLHVAEMYMQWLNAVRLLRF